MTEGKFTKIAICIVVAILVLFLLSIGVRIFTRVILIETLCVDNAFTQAVMFDNKTLTTPLKLDANLDLKTRIGKFSKDYLALYTNFTECAKAYNHMLDWTIEKYDEESILTLGNDYHVGTIPKMDVAPFINQICRFNAFLKANDMPFLYAALPGKISQDDSKISGVIDFSNQNYDTILNAVREDGAEVFDLRENLAKVFDDHHAQFFNTDHHWRPETGLWAAGELAKYLNEKHGYAFDLEKFKSEKFTTECYEKILLGTYGRRLTLSVAEPEDLNLLYPTYPTDLTIEIPSRNMHNTGDFDVYYSHAMLMRGDYYHSVPYSAYMYGDLSLIKLTNNDCDNRRSVLVVGDSMDNTLLPFLSLGIRHITAIDLRAFQGSLQAYIEEHKGEYDMVIVTNSVISVIDEKLFDFS